MYEYVYPKVPNYYHDSVPDEFFTADDLVMVEKLDGSNCKICVYDESYSELYSDDIHEHNPEDGDVFISSKKVVRGRLSDPVNEFDDAFARLVHTLRELFNVDAIKDLHKEYDSPLLLYGEHMVKHSLDYGYEENPPPAFIGFDVLLMRDHEPAPANPFDERFDGFLPIDDAYEIIEVAGLETAPIVDQDASGVDPDSLHIPMSEYAVVEAEGVVLRSDDRNRRVKHVTEKFRERAQESWGLHEQDAESGAELFSARYITNARVRKTVNKLLHRHDENEITPSVVAQAVVADAWEEELADIQTIGIELTPADVYEQAEMRSNAVIDTMQTNAALNDTTIGGLWEEYHADTIAETTVPSFDVSPNELSNVVGAVEDATDVEQALVETQVSEEQIHDVAESIARRHGRDIGRWVIEETCDEIENTFWYGSLGIIANLPIGFTPGEINDAIVRYVTEQIEARDDVEIDEKPDDWEPNISDADTSSLGELF